MLRRLRLTCLAFLLLTPLLRSEMIAAEVTFEERLLKNGNTVRRLFLEGAIEQGDLEKIRASAGGRIVLTITLWSRGGSIAEAIAIADHLNENLITANVPILGFPREVDPPIVCRPDWKHDKKPRNISNCVCNSACAIIWLTAPFRTGELVGLHRPRFHYEEFAGLSPELAQQRYRELLDSLSKYLLDRDVPSTLIEKLLSVPSTSNYLLSEGEVDSVGDTRPYLVELLHARCERFATQLEIEEQLNRDLESALENYVTNDEERRQIYEQARDRLSKFQALSEYRKCQSAEKWKMRAERQGIMLLRSP